MEKQAILSILVAVDLLPVRVRQQLQQVAPSFERAQRVFKMEKSPKLLDSPTFHNACFAVKRTDISAAVRWLNLWRLEEAHTSNGTITPLRVKFTLWQRIQSGLAAAMGDAPLELNHGEPVPIKVKAKR